MEKTEQGKYRVTLQEVTVTAEGEEQTRAQVRLTLADRSEQAERVGPNSENAVLLSVALATLDAIKGLLPYPLDLRIEYVKQVTPRPGSPATILSLIRLHQAGRATLLNGCCPVLDSVHKTAARSVLDALNRKIEYVLEQHDRREQIGDQSSKLERAGQESAAIIGLMDSLKAQAKFQEALVLDGDDTGALPRTNGTGAPDKEGTEAAPVIWNFKVSRRIAIIAAAVILASVGMLFFLLGRAPARLSEATPELSSMQALKIVYNSPSAEQGKTVLEKADQIIKEQKLGASSNGHWLVMSGEKSGQFLVFLSFQDEQKRPQRARWIVDIEKKQAVPANIEAESISGRAQP